MKEKPPTFKTHTQFLKKKISKSNQKKVFESTEPYLKKFVSMLPRKAVINIYALYKFVKDPKVSFAKKAIAFSALLYFITPFDAVPDMIPVAGFLDDIGVVSAAVMYLKKTLPPYIKAAEAELIKKEWIKKQGSK